MREFQKIRHTKLVPMDMDLKEAAMYMRQFANTGVYEGIGLTSYFLECMWLLSMYECQVIFTRDTNHHSSGWWKNPMYERCYHLSIKFDGERKQKHLIKILAAVYGKNVRFVWSEPPYSAQGKAGEIWHYRVFCDQHWQPILPKGEVYSKEFTERGWKSYSEVQADHAKKFPNR